MNFAFIFTILFISFQSITAFNIIELFVSHSIPNNYKQISDCDVINDEIRSDKINLICHESASNLLFHNEANIICNDDKIILKSDIEMIELQNCKIDHIQIEYFQNFPILRHLNVSNSGLKKLFADDFIGASKLTQFIASHNKLTELSDSMFIHAWKILAADFEDNQIHTIQRFAFDGASKLRILDLSRNSLTSIPNGIFYGLNDLKVLYLSKNKITQIEWNAFNDNIFCMQLKWLDLSHNHIESLDVRTFQNMTHLNTLNLANMSIAQIQSDMFKNTMELRKLYLSLNQIKSINFTMLTPWLDKLSELYLDGNQIKRFDEFDGQSLPNLTVLGIADNLFSCYYGKKLMEQIKQRDILVFPDTVSEGAKDFRGVVCHD